MAEHEPRPTSAMTSGERRPDPFRYFSRDGVLVVGTVWAPGPLSRSVWVLPDGATRSAQAVVVRHPAAGWPRYHRCWYLIGDAHTDWPEVRTWWEDWRVLPGGQHYDQDVVRETTYESGLSSKDWREALAADATIVLDYGVEDAA